MHYESPYNSKIDRSKVDLLEPGKREQCASDVRLNPCVALMGYEPLRTQRYDWCKR